jgi:hypothetical protein
MSLLLETHSTQGPLEEFLFNYEGAGGLSINWMIFGSDGHCHPPPGVLGYFIQGMHLEGIVHVVGCFSALLRAAYCMLVILINGQAALSLYVGAGHTAVLDMMHTTLHLFSCCERQM